MTEKKAKTKVKKTVTKKAVKKDTKKTIKTVKKTVKKEKGKPKAKTKPTNHLNLKKKILKKTPQEFKGRFGQKHKRKVSKKKWQKWRYPKGMDIEFEREYGAVVKSGYRSNKEIRNLHPSGFREVLVNTPKDLEGIDNKTHAVRLSAKTGKRKRIEIRTKAKEMNLRILN